MKATSYICLTLMLFLMAQPIIINCQESMQKAKPCVVAKTTCGGNRCSKKPETKESDPADSKERIPQDGCNPFAACSQCHFVAAIKIDYPSAPIVEIGNRLIPHNESIYSAFTGECWNPPEAC